MEIDIKFNIENSEELSRAVSALVESASFSVREDNLDLGRARHCLNQMLNLLEDIANLECEKRDVAVAKYLLYHAKAGVHIYPGLRTRLENES